MMNLNSVSPVDIALLPPSGGVPELSKGDSVEEVQPEGFVVGFDIAAAQSEYCVCEGVTPVQRGSLRLEEIPEFLSTLARKGIVLRAMACEFTGGIGGPWLAAFWEAGVPSFVLHTVERRAMLKLDSTVTKTDQADAALIGRMLARWFDPSIRAVVGLNPNLFQSWQQVRPAWELRALVEDARKAAELARIASARGAAASRAGQDRRSGAWVSEAEALVESSERFFQIAIDYARETFPVEFGLLMGIPQVGEKVAVMLLGILMPIERFIEYRHREGAPDKALTRNNVCRYIGFMPRFESSGGRTLRNEKYSGGHSEVRALLFMACLGTSTGRGFFGRHYMELTARNVPKKKAIWITAKKLLEVATSILISGRPFVDPEAPPPVEKPTRPAEYLSASEAARLVDMTRAGLYLRRDKGKLSHVVWEGDGKKYFLRSELEALVRYGRG